LQANQNQKTGKRKKGKVKEGKGKWVASTKGGEKIEGWNAISQVIG